jgi:hypothetical protein
MNLAFTLLVSWFIFTLSIVPTDAPASIDDYTGFFRITSQNAEIFGKFLGFTAKFHAQCDLKRRSNPQNTNNSVIYRI